jgi:hypothetical protein
MNIIHVTITTRSETRRLRFTVNTTCTILMF